MYIFLLEVALIKNFQLTNTTYNIQHIFSKNSEKCIMLIYENSTNGWNNGSGEVNIGKDLYNKDLASFKFNVTPNGNLFNPVLIQTTPVNTTNWGLGPLDVASSQAGAQSNTLIILEQSGDKDAYDSSTGSRQDRALEEVVFRRRYKQHTSIRCQYR